MDNYIGLKTLEKLINIRCGVDVSIFSDNLVKGLRQSAFDDFSKEYPNLKIQLFHADGIFHDRYIILDYGTNLEDPDRKKYEPMIKELLKNKKLLLK